MFLAGPTPARGSGVPSWRPDAIDELAEQITWKLKARAHANVNLFWIPRDLRTMPAMTTNVEFGFDLACGRRMVLGAPPDCPSPDRNRYLVHLAHLAAVPVRATLRDTITAVVDMLANADT